MAEKRKLPRGIDMVGKWYRARISVDGRQYHVGLWPTLTDAKTALAVAWGQKAAGTFIPPADRRRLAKARRAEDERAALTLRQWSDVWLETLTKDDRSPGTISSYRSTLKVHILPVLGDRRLIDVEPEDVTELLDAVRAKGGPWGNVARTLRAAFRAAVAVNAGGLTESPVQVTIKKDGHATSAIDEGDVATPAEVRAFAEAMPADLAIAVQLAAWCALRLGEVLGLQRRDFEHLDDPRRATLHVRRQWNTKASPPEYTKPKDDSGRVVAIPASLVPAIVAHLDAYTGPDPESPLLPGSVDPHRPVSQTKFDKAWREARSGVRPGHRFHALRHVGLTRYAQQGATVQEVMARGGHKDMKAAMRYQHAERVRDRTLTNKLDEMIGEADE